MALLDLWGVYFMTFIDISYRLAVMATCTNRKWKIWDFGAHFRFWKKFMGSSNWPSSTCGGLYHNFNSYLQPFDSTQQRSSDGSTPCSPCIRIPWVRLRSRRTSKCGRDVLVNVFWARVRSLTTYSKSPLLKLVISRLTQRTIHGPASRPSCPASWNCLGYILGFSSYLRGQIE